MSLNLSLSFEGVQRPADNLSISLSSDDAATFPLWGQAEDPSGRQATTFQPRHRLDN
jgi:hypothetical protein